MKTFEKIRTWAYERDLYRKGDPKTQVIKLMEEVGELSKAILNNNHPEIMDGIGDCVVVLTNLAELCDTSIETCLHLAYEEIKDRHGKIVNGSFKKSK
jgi:NTP pyrophosphatase (non-canonical NTP hydrolase)